ncbi:26S proteasome subunit RPN7 (macronuclear) [Tetrahymena thermophila SB210]|uniref:26S proteasome subunit RPN7 n=1 Tax=Tetrahymena thermophila (strain SB210) TaxID=312017 RepID=Q23YR6_TETTS|nr:26S proteasome subunit RPN7 [Tetrahymena thermophila SB210]EAS01656.2 26S proteasome subunit RPN7 [Tetrahymena thermophila SB210]|eukprot:XP_001021901.2 26S proteasome subunit RPN7 [Tetrahymena thermophila SB210]
MDGLIEYSNRYNGVTKIFKIIQGATLLKPPHINQAFETALILAQQLKIYSIYRFVESTALDWKITTLRVDKELAAQQFAPYQAQAEKLDKEINMHKNSQNKLSTGLSYIELGNLYLKAGDVTEAFRSYERVYKYYEAGDIYSYFPQWCATMIIERRYDQLQQVYPKEAIPIEKKKREQYTTLLVFQALRCLYQGFQNDFLQIIKDELQHDCIVEDENLLLVTSLREIGVFITVCALARLSRSQVQDLLKSDSIRFFVTQDNECLNILECYISLDYKTLISKLKLFYQEYNQDFIFKKFNFSEILTDKLVKQYLLPYKKISIQKVVNIMGLNQDLALDYLKKLIQNNQINFLYDPIEEVLVQKETEKTKKYETYQKAVKVIASFLHKKQKQMLRYHLGIVHSENGSKNKQDVIELGNMHGFSSLNKVINNFMNFESR